MNTLPARLLVPGVITLVSVMPFFTQIALERASASSASSSSSVASVASGTGALDVYVTDNKDTVQPGDTLQYTAVVRNVSSMRTTSDIVIRVSPSTEISDINPVTAYESTTLTWNAVTFEPGQVRTFTFNGTVRRNMRDGAAVDVHIQAGLSTAQDRTILQKYPSSGSFSSTFVSSSSASSVLQSSASVKRHALFLKTADAAEVFPGAEIRYTLFIQNVLLTTIDDAVILDRYDSSLMHVVDAGGADVRASGQLQWTLPRLFPGASWEKSYTLAVSDEVPNGTIVSNIASITGQDVAYATLNEKVIVVRTGVVHRLPSAGAPMDALLVLLSIPVAMTLAGVQSMRLKRR